jgi:small nuclear ribonucleoprotein E
MVQPINLIFRMLQQVVTLTQKSRVQVWLFENTDMRIEGLIIVLMFNHRGLMNL